MIDNPRQSYAGHGEVSAARPSARDGQVEFVDRIPSADEHNLLFQSVGWATYELEELEKALKGSLAGTVAESEGEIIAMGRVVGDGGKFFYLQDLVVVPHRQGEGIGRMVLDRLITQVETMAPVAPFIGVFATQEAVEMYRRFGLTEGFGGLTGMAKLG